MKRPGTTLWLVIAAVAAGGFLLWDRGNGSHTPVRSVGGTRNTTSAKSVATNAPSRTASTNEFQSLATWVAERNIFDSSRQPRIPGAPPRPPSRPRTADAPSFTLVGVLKAQKGPVAFFDSGTTEYRKALPLNGTIAGYTVTDITSARVRLSISNQPPVELRVGSRMRQDGETGWQLADAGSIPSTTVTGGSTTSPGSNATAAGSTGNAAEDEILKRLMKKREQESQ